MLKMQCDGETTPPTHTAVSSQSSVYLRLRSKDPDASSKESIRGMTDSGISRSQIRSDLGHNNQSESDYLINCMVRRIVASGGFSARLSAGASVGAVTLRPERARSFVNGYCPDCNSAHVFTHCMRMASPVPADGRAGCLLMTTNPTVFESTIRTPFPMSGERIKGGERRMASEWEELEKLSKEELVIELVKARRDLRNIRSMLADLSETGASEFMYDEGSKPSEEWLTKIAELARSRIVPGEALSAADLEMYGIDEETADRYIESGRSQGNLRTAGRSYGIVF